MTDLQFIEIEFAEIEIGHCIIDVIALTNALNVQPIQLMEIAG